VLLLLLLLHVQLAKANADKTAVLLAEAHCKAHKYEGCKEVRAALRKAFVV
jgi:hypothetical protein